MPRSNTRVLNLGAAGAPGFLALVDHSDDRVVPRTLRIRSRLVGAFDSEEMNTSGAQGLAAGLWWSDPAWQQSGDALGCMRIRYGSVSGISRETFADLREGEYNVPPCGSVSVQIAYWRSFPEQSANPLEVSAEIADGDCIESTPLIFTAAIDIDMQPEIGQTPHPGQRYCPAPPGAYAFEISARRGVVAHGTTMAVERDPVSGRWLPPSTPILLGRQRGVTCWPIDLDPVFEGEQATFVFSPEITFFVR